MWRDGNVLRREAPSSLAVTGLEGVASHPSLGMGPVWDPGGRAAGSGFHVSLLGRALPFTTHPRPVLRMRQHHLPRRRSLGEKDRSVESHPGLPSCHVTANVSIWGQTKTSFSVDSVSAMVCLQAVGIKAPESLDLVSFHG